MSVVQCSSFPRCSGCQWIGVPEEEQKKRKIKDLQERLKVLNQDVSVDWASPGFFGLRDRLDFVWEEGRLGLYSVQEKKIIDLLECGQLSPALSAWYQDFRRFKWPVKKGSFRLRIGPQNPSPRGVWLDFANEDIKKLLDEGSLLRELLTLSAVEIGQKRKRPREVGSDLKLAGPDAFPWFETQFRGRATSLFCHIASFTQPSFRGNQKMLETLGEWLKEIKPTRASEFGSGIGNFSVFLLGWAESLRIFESDALSVEAFRKTLQTHAWLEGTEAKVEFNVGDYQRARSLDFVQDELLLVNPPRSGLRDFLETLKGCPQRPTDLFYISCSPDSWTEDGHRLQELGYGLHKVSVVDQFPQTNHYEILSWWRKD